MADNQTIFLQRIRETRPDLANQSDEALTNIFSQIRPDIFKPQEEKQKVTIIMNDDDQDKLNSLGMNIPAKQYQPQYSLTAIKDPV
jgi:predicted ATPase